MNNTPSPNFDTTRTGGNVSGKFRVVADVRSPRAEPNTDDKLRAPVRPDIRGLAVNKPPKAKPFNPARPPELRNGQPLP